MRDKPRLVMEGVLILLLVVITIYALSRLSLAGRRVRVTSTPGNLLLKSGVPLEENNTGDYWQDPAYFWGRLEMSPRWGNAQGNLLAKSGATAFTSHNEADSEGEIDAENRGTTPPGNLWYNPSITVDEALSQVPRVARTRQVDEDEIIELISCYTEGNLFGLLGPARVNVQDINQALDAGPQY